MGPSLRIALIIETETSRGRGVLTGVYQYSRPDRPWFIRACPPTVQSLAAVKAWEPHGVIIHVSGSELESELESLDVPAVCVSNTMRSMRFPYVCFDDPAVGRMGTAYFAGRGFCNFAFFGSPTNLASRHRQQGFEESLAKEGFNCHLLHIPHLSPEQDQWGPMMVQLGDWIAGLPKPLALMAFTDSYALMAADACLQREIKVPSEVAILGVDNDEMLCNRAFPPLSSIDIDAHSAGFVAARLLERMMARRRPPARPTWIRPTRVVTRGSSDVLAVSDPYVLQAERYIVENISPKLSVDDLAAALPISRRALEKRFQAALRRSPLQEIQRVRVLRAQDLLLSTDKTVSAVAKEAGFRNTRHFWENFRRHTGLKPLQFRKLGKRG